MLTLPAPEPRTELLKYVVAQQTNKKGEIIGKLFILERNGKYTMCYYKPPIFTTKPPYSGSRGNLTLMGYDCRDPQWYSKNKLKQLVKAGFNYFKNQTGWKLTVDVT